MKTVVDEFGWNAGKVWKTLSTQGPLRQDALLRTTRLTQDELWAAVGWLARENKIRMENNMYKLGETNLTTKIGADAGKVWTLILWAAIDIGCELEVVPPYLSNTAADWFQPKP